MAARVSAHLAEMPVRWNDLIVTFGFDLVADRVEVTEVRRERKDGGAVSFATRPPLARLAKEALEQLRTRWAPLVVRQGSSEATVSAARALLDAPGPRRGRPPLYGPSHWYEVARIHAGGGTDALVEHYGLSRSTAGKWIRRATPSPEEGVRELLETINAMGPPGSKPHKIIVLPPGAHHRPM